MTSSFKVVDIFAGPGGLAEGFSSIQRNDKRVFQICLSVEKERSAFATLRMRSFVRQFGGRLPEEYYRFLGGMIGRDRLISAYPEQWTAACAETHLLELGAPGTGKTLDPILDRIRSESSGNAILVGGPPCQAYSLVGRARNQGNADYVPSEDHRHFLYREYIRILGRLRPVAFLMENVKGMLSSNVDGERIFTQVLADLRAAGGEPDSYEIIPLVKAQGNGGQEYVLYAEQLGIPQKRHRVILFGLRRDLASVGGNFTDLLLKPTTHRRTVAEVLARMPALRSGLSKETDTPEAWRNTVAAAFRLAALAAFEEEDEELDRVASRLERFRAHLAHREHILPRRSQIPAPITDEELRQWLADPELSYLPNHESRGHMASDLARYAFAAAFAEVTGRSPKASDFPNALAPDHDNWSSGKFNDRFRVQCWNSPSSTVTSHISKDGHYFIHPDPSQCRSLTVREAARLQTFPDNYFFEGNRTQQYVQVGNAVPPLLASKIADVVYGILERCLQRVESTKRREEAKAANGEIAVPRKWTKTEAFAYFNVELENVRWSWSGLSKDGDVLALVLWQDALKGTNGELRYRDDEELDAEWRERIGAKRRIEHLKHAVTHLDGRFHAVIAKAVDTTADPRKIEKCFPQQDTAWQIDSFDENTGAFTAHALRAS